MNESKLAKMYMKTYLNVSFTFSLMTKVNPFLLFNEI